MVASSRSSNTLRPDTLFEGSSYSHNLHRRASSASGTRELVSTDERVDLWFYTKCPLFPELVIAVAIP